MSANYSSQAPLKSKVHARNISSGVWIVHSVCPSVGGWNTCSNGVMSRMPLVISARSPSEIVSPGLTLWNEVLYAIEQFR